MVPFATVSSASAFSLFAASNSAESFARRASSMATFSFTSIRRVLAFSSMIVASARALRLGSTPTTTS